MNKAEPSVQRSVVVFGALFYKVYMFGSNAAERHKHVERWTNSPKRSLDIFDSTAFRETLDASSSAMCDSISASSHAVFAVCPDMLPEFPARDKTACL